MKKQKFTFAILTIICLQTNLFADIAPNPIKAKSISPKHQTSIRMESEKVIIDLYNDSSVVKCLFNMKNLGKKEKIQIGFPEMGFQYYLQNSKLIETMGFKVKENGMAVNFDFSGSLGNEEIYRRKVESYKIKEEWYLWQSEFQQGESKTIEVHYSLPFGMLYKTNERFFMYLLSTGANWKGTIGKAEIIINLKDIEMDSIISIRPDNCVKSNKQLIWTFSDFEPSPKNDIRVLYNSSKILYNGSKRAPLIFLVDNVVDENLVNKIDLETIDTTEIASIDIFMNSEETLKYTSQKCGIVKIYTKKFVLTELNKLINEENKDKIILSDYDKLTKDYCLYIDGVEVGFAKVIGIEKKSIAKLEIKNIKHNKRKIMIDLKK